MRALVVAVFATACAHAPLPPAPDAPVVRPPNQERHYTVWLGGARVGSIIERELWTDAGVTLRRTETMRFLRGDTLVALVTNIEVTANTALVPSKIEWSQLGPANRQATAIRHAHGWRIEVDDGAPRAALPPDA